MTTITNRGSVVEQSYQQHRRYVPGYHFITLGVLTVYLGWALWRLVAAFSTDTVMGVLLAVGAGLLAWYVRAFAMGVQDRVIRLEETMRMERVLPADLKGRIGELRRGQFVALRFAPDDELAALVRSSLDEQLDKSAIKRRIVRWRADHFRA